MRLERGEAQSRSAQGRAVVCGFRLRAAKISHAPRGFESTLIKDGDSETRTGFR